MRSALFLFTLGLSLLAIDTALAKRGAIETDLSTGVVFPSDNSAIYDNPAALVRSNMTFEGLIGFETGNDTRFESTLVTSAGPLGLGGGFRFDGNDFTGLLSLGVGSHGLSGGLGVRIADSFDFDLGAQFETMSPVRVGILVKSFVGGVDEIRAGAGYRQKTSFQFEGDLVYEPTSENFFLDPAIAVFVKTINLSLVLGYKFRVSPSFGDGTLRAGFNWWLIPNISLEFLFEFPLSKYTMGFKYSI